MTALVVTIAQLNAPSVTSTATSLDAARAEQAARDGAALVVFPELTLTGYHPGDLLDEPPFSNGSRGLARCTRRNPPNARAVLGRRRPHGAHRRGQAPANRCWCCKTASCSSATASSCCPPTACSTSAATSSLGRTSRPCSPSATPRVGFMICEDGWNEDGQLYQANPFQRLAEAAPDLVVSINASPSNVGKREQRQRFVRRGLPSLRLAAAVRESSGAEHDFAGVRRAHRLPLRRTMASCSKPNASCQSVHTLRLAGRGFADLSGTGVRLGFGRRQCRRSSSTRPANRARTASLRAALRLSTASRRAAPAVSTARSPWRSPAKR